MLRVKFTKVSPRIPIRKGMILPEGTVLVNEPRFLHQVKRDGYYEDVFTQEERYNVGGMRVVHYVPGSPCCLPEIWLE